MAAGVQDASGEQNIETLRNAVVELAKLRALVQRDAAAADVLQSSAEQAAAEGSEAAAEPATDADAATGAAANVAEAPAPPPELPPELAAAATEAAKAAAAVTAPDAAPEPAAVDEAVSDAATGADTAPAAEESTPAVTVRKMPVAGGSRAAAAQRRQSVAAKRRSTVDAYPARRSRLGGQEENERPRHAVKVGEISKRVMEEAEALREHLAGARADLEGEPRPPPRSREEVWAAARRRRPTGDYAARRSSASREGPGAAARRRSRVPAAPRVMLRKLPGRAGEEDAAGAQHTSAEPEAAPEGIVGADRLSQAGERASERRRSGPFVRRRQAPSYEARRSGGEGRRGVVRRSVDFSARRAQQHTPMPAVKPREEPPAAPPPVSKPPAEREPVSAAEEPDQERRRKPPIMRRKVVSYAARRSGSEERGGRRRSVSPKSARDLQAAASGRGTAHANGNGAAAPVPEPTNADGGFWGAAHSTTASTSSAGSDTRANRPDGGGRAPYVHRRGTGNYAARRSSTGGGGYRDRRASVSGRSGAAPQPRQDATETSFFSSAAQDEQPPSTVRQPAREAPSGRGSSDTRKPFIQRKQSVDYSARRRASTGGGGGARGSQHRQRIGAGYSDSAADNSGSSGGPWSSGEADGGKSEGQRDPQQEQPRVGANGAAAGASGGAGGRRRLDALRRQRKVPDYASRRSGGARGDSTRRRSVSMQSSASMQQPPLGGGGQQGGGGSRDPDTPTRLERMQQERAASMQLRGSPSQPRRRSLGAGRTGVVWSGDNRRRRSLVRRVSADYHHKSPAAQRRRAAAAAAAAAAASTKASSIKDGSEPADSASSAKAEEVRGGGQPGGRGAGSTVARRRSAPPVLRRKVPDYSARRSSNADSGAAQRRRSALRFPRSHLPADSPSAPAADSHRQTTARAPSSGAHFAVCVVGVNARTRVVCCVTAVPCWGVVSAVPFHHSVMLVASGPALCRGLLRSCQQRSVRGRRQCQHIPGSASEE